MPLRLSSTLSEETELVVSRIIGCALAVHRELGPGFLESIYTAALCLELSANGLTFERERTVFVNYRNTLLGGQRVDLIVENAVILEIMAVSRLDPVFQAKLISYLRTTGLRVGLLINFNTPLFKEGIQRIVL